MVELSEWKSTASEKRKVSHGGVFKGLEARVKGALTRAINQQCTTLPYTTATKSTRSRGHVDMDTEMEVDTGTGAEGEGDGADSAEVGSSSGAGGVEGVEETSAAPDEDPLIARKQVYHP